MSNANIALRQMLDSTLNKFRGDLKKKGKEAVPTAETSEMAARTLLGIIEMNMQPTGLPGDSPRPWGVMSELEKWKEITVWALEKQL